MGGGIFPEILLIYMDSQAAIMPLTNGVSMSILTHEYRVFLSEFQIIQMFFIQFPRHRDIVENYIVFELARACTDMLQGLGTSIVSVKLTIIPSFYGVDQPGRQKKHFCNIARLCWYLRIEIGPINFYP